MKRGMISMLLVEVEQCVRPAGHSGDRVLHSTADVHYIARSNHYRFMINTGLIQTSLLKYEQTVQ